jgi:Glycosyl transferase family 2
MKLVQTLVVRDEADIVDAQIAFHLNAGVDFVIATDHDSGDGTTEILESYARQGHLHLIRESGKNRESKWDTHMARLAATEYGADWMIDCDADEFWWPRGESLKEILAAIPKRYTAVQGLIRPFVPQPDDGSFFAEQMTVRRSVQSTGNGGNTFEHALRAVNRVDPIGLVPLRSWYPIEIFDFRNRGGEPLDERQKERGLADGSLVADTRLRDALRALRLPDSTEGGTAGGFALPVDGTSRLEFPTPDVVDDAAYAVECAAVGEVDLGQLERRIDELEAKLARLERRFWTRVRGRVVRVTRRPRRAVQRT